MAEEIGGFLIHRAWLDRAGQERVTEDIRAVIAAAPLVRPVTAWGRPMSVRMTSAGRLGWVIDRGLWGQGLATEAAAAALADVFRRVGLEQVVSYTSPDNTASLRVMEKLGLVRGGKTRWNGSEHVWYSITADRVPARKVSD